MLFGDFNETTTEENSGIGNLATGCGLVDAFSVRLGTSEHPNTYNRGTRRLDYALLSPALMANVKEAGYDPFDY